MGFEYDFLNSCNFFLSISGNGGFKGSLLGISVGTVTHSGTVVTSTKKMWRTMQALGAIAFAYSYSLVLIEIQVLPSFT